MLLVLVGCVAMIVSGKKARDRGETLTDRNLEWHKKYSEGKEEEVKNIGVFGKQIMYIFQYLLFKKNLCNCFINYYQPSKVYVETFVVFYNLKKMFGKFKSGKNSYF